MRLTDLKPAFLRYVDDSVMHIGDPPDVSIGDADGVMFLCPKCFQENGGTAGTHQVICNRPRVPQSEHRVGPGRWEFQGSGFEDLTLVAGSSSILLHGGCAAHFFIENGAIRMS